MLITKRLKTLSEEAHVDFDETLSKAAASRRIDELQHQTGRGLQGKSPGESHAEAADGETKLSIGSE